MWLASLRRLPVEMHFALLVAVLAAMFTIAVWRAGGRDATQRVHHAAVRDSVRAQRAVVDKITLVADSTVRSARYAVKATAASRKHTRAVLAASVAAIPVAVMEAVGARITEDSLTIAHLDDAVTARTHEVLARVTLDTLQEHQVLASSQPSASGLGLGNVALHVVIVAAILETARRLVLHFLHRHDAPVPIP